MPVCTTESHHCPLSGRNLLNVGKVSSTGWLARVLAPGHKSKPLSFGILFSHLNTPCFSQILKVSANDCPQNPEDSCPYAEPKNFLISSFEHLLEDEIISWSLPIDCFTMTSNHPTHFISSFSKCLEVPLQIG